MNVTCPRRDITDVKQQSLTHSIDNSVIVSIFFFYFSKIYQIKLILKLKGKVYLKIHIELYQVSKELIF